MTPERRSNVSLEPPPDEPTPEIDPINAENALKQGELYLSAQLQAGLAADQRATTIAALFAGFSAAISAVSLGYWDKTSDIPILVSGLSGAVLMALGSLICLWAARPINFFYPGNHPESWMNILDRPSHEVMIGEALNYQQHIEANDRSLSANAKFLWRGAMLAIASPLLAVVIWIVASSIFSPSAPAVKASAGSQAPSSSGASPQTFP